jgi:hypothetical protein
MNTIILCEGRVDATLIGQYLIKNGEWSFSKKESKFGVNPQPEDKSQIINKYKRDADWIYIWGVGGRTRFENPIRKVMEINRIDRDNVKAFNQMIIIVDRDDEENCETIQNEFVQCIESVELKWDEWSDCNFTDKFGQVGIIKIMLLIIPFNENGALETVMINALDEKDDEDLITQCKDFIDNVKTQKYLRKRREKLKARLSTIISIISPDRAVDSMVEIVEGIEWNKYQTVNEAFRKLKEL